MKFTVKAMLAVPVTIEVDAEDERGALLAAELANYVDWHVADAEDWYTFNEEACYVSRNKVLADILTIKMRAFENASDCEENRDKMRTIIRGDMLAEGLDVTDENLEDAIDMVFEVFAMADRAADADPGNTRMN